ncbi:hypothetical protein [Kineococcus gypseus]|uniref:hypothetical protein n=1 Tax=Kineococcus gypseus TaxID=1637102 RepID=UPI003D7EFD4B
MSQATSPAPGSDEQLRARFDAIRAAVHEQLRRADAQRADAERTRRHARQAPSDDTHRDSNQDQ